MTSLPSILMAQINPKLGSIEQNGNEIIATIEQNQANYDVIIFPELCITGYPPEDLLFRDELYQRVEKQLNHIANCTKDCHVIVGHPLKQQNNYYNSASVFLHGKQLGTYRKQKLPNYLVFDEKRYFKAGDSEFFITINGTQVALLICEDIWHDEVVQRVSKAGAQLILCLNASPFYQGKAQLRQTTMTTTAEKHGIAIVYVNTVGGQDELVFDGHSFAVNAKGKVVTQSPGFKSALTEVNWASNASTTELIESAEAEIYQALVCGTRDYVNKNGFKGVLLGLSGGIDSALTLAIAHDALGANNVHAVMMPSRYTANMSCDDAAKQAHNLGVKYSVIAIETLHHQFLEALTHLFNHLPADTTEENIQARIRGTLLMALSNKFAKLVLTTGNKSEMAVGYATLYGDMAGGFAVLKDVPKTLVYRLAHYRNSLSPDIPERVITRAPSAELREDQCDQDSLPDYDILDQILHSYVEDDLSCDDIIKQGFDAATVKQVIRLIDLNEYKRRQAPPGIRISKRAFGRDWRYPITSGFNRG